MACYKEKVTLGIALAGVVTAVGGTALTSTTPAALLGLVASAAAGAGLALALINLAECLEQNGQPEMARTLREQARQIDEELDRLRRFAADHGVAIP